MDVRLYGIPNCDTVRKARQSLDDRGAAYTFHDYKKQGVPEERLRAWMSRLGWEALLNRRGTTFRKLPDAAREPIDEAKAVAIMLAHPSTIRRPVAEVGDDLLVGFNPDEWRRTFG